MNAFFRPYSAKNHCIPLGWRIDIRQIGLLYKSIVCRDKRAAVALSWLPTEQPCQLPEKTSVAQFGLEKHDRLWFRRKMRPCWSLLIGAERSSSCSFPGPKGSRQRRSTHHPVLCEIVLQDPWEIYEPCAGIFYGRPLILARHRKCKTEFVHVQVCAVERSTIETMVQTVD
jgi:hypothetical protein